MELNCQSFRPIKKLFNRQNGIYLISFRSAGFLRLLDVHDDLSNCVVYASVRGTATPYLHGWGELGAMDGRGELGAMDGRGDLSVCV